MFEFSYAELWGTIGSVVVLISMCFDVETPVGSFLLRFLNVVGCIIYIYYGILINSFSVLMLNTILLVVNVIYLLKKPRKKNKDDK